MCVKKCGEEGECECIYRCKCVVAADRRFHERVAGVYKGACNTEEVRPDYVGIPKSPINIS